MDGGESVKERKKESKDRHAERKIERERENIKEKKSEYRPDVCCHGLTSKRLNATRGSRRGRRPSNQSWRGGRRTSRQEEALMKSIKIANRH